MTEYLSQFELNNISVERKSLSFEEAVAVWLMRFSGQKQQTIANRFGTNLGRVADVLNGKKHQGSKEEALALRLS